MYVSEISLNLHVSPDAESDVITVPYMTELKYIGSAVNYTGGSWDEVEYAGKTYYFWTTKTESLLTDEKSSFAYSSENKYRQEVINTALNIYTTQDTEYRRNDSTGVADANGKYGYDCSGFVSYVLRSVMKNYVPTYTYYAKVSEMLELGALYNEGLNGEFSAKDISVSELQPGDLIFFYLTDEAVDDEDDISSAVATHVGMYLGNNEFIHCTHYNWGGSGVFIMPLSGEYSEKIVACRRFIPDKVTAANEIMYINGFNINVRDDMSAEADVVDTIYGFNKVNVLFTGNVDWAYIEYGDGQFGYVDVDYLTMSDPAASGEDMYVSSTLITLYSEPKSDCSSTKTLYTGENVECIGQFYDSTFYAIRYDNRIWYLYAPQGLDGLLTNDYDALMSGKETYIVTSGVNIRSTPVSDNDSNIIGKLNTGTKVKLIAVGQSNIWAYVKTDDGVCGYVLLERLEIDEGSQDSDTTEMYVAKYSIVLYSEPSSAAAETLVLPVMTKLDCYGMYLKSSYAKVGYNGSIWYVYIENDISEKLTENLAALQAGIGEYTVTSGMNMRSAPDASDSSNIIGTLKKGSNVTVIAVNTTETWAYVRTDSGEYGYASWTKLTPAT